MRTYVVQRGDSPASIAARDDMAGCPKCARELVLANRHKQSVVRPNGFITFVELRVGEVLALPDSWFNGEHDARPPAYFKRLPHADGVTPGALGDVPAPAPGLSTGTLIGIATAGVVVLGGVAYVATTLWPIGRKLRRTLRREAYTP